MEREDVTNQSARTQQHVQVVQSSWYRGRRRGIRRGVGWGKGGGSRLYVAGTKRVVWLDRCHSCPETKAMEVKLGSFRPIRGHDASFVPCERPNTIRMSGGGGDAVVVAHAHEWCESIISPPPCLPGPPPTPDPKQRDDTRRADMQVSTLS